MTVMVEDTNPATKIIISNQDMVMKAVMIILNSNNIVNIMHNMVTIKVNMSKLHKMDPVVRNALYFWLQQDVLTFEL